MKLFNVIIHLLIALSFLLLIGIIYTFTEELSDLREGYRVQSQEIIALRGYLGIVDDKADRIVGEVRKIVNIPYSKFIPIDEGWLAIRGEEINAQ